MSRTKSPRRPSGAHIPRRKTEPGPTPALATLALVGVVLALYWSGLRHPLVFDDYHLSTHALRTYYANLLGRFGELRWLSDATFGAVYLLGGPGVFWHRLANALLHGAVAALLFQFLARLFAAVLSDERARPLAFFGALWFAVNPVSVYGVAYLMQRSIVLATLFSIAALACFLEGLLRGQRRWYVASVVAYFLAVSSKEHAIMMPALALALAWLLPGRSRDLVWCFVGFALVGAHVIAQRFSLIGTVYEPFAVTRIPVPELAYPLSIVSQGMLFFRYLGTWLVPWPGWMSIDLRVPFPTALIAWPETAGFLAWIGYAIAALGLLGKRGTLGLAGFGLLFPWLFGLTEFSAARVQEPFVLYRSYLWMCGLPAVLPALLPVVLTRPLPRWGYGAFGVVFVALAAGAHERIGSMASAYAVWDDAVRKNADSGLSGTERAYLSRGAAHLDAARLEAANADFQRAMELNPRSPEPYAARATYRLRVGQLEAALQDLDRAVALDPKYPAAYHKRCFVKAHLNRPLEALADCDRTVELIPGDDEAWINRGVLQRSLGRLQEAEASYKRALEIRPAGGMAHYNYGVLLLGQGRRDAAVKEHLAAACRSRIAEACRLLRGL